MAICLKGHYGLTLNKLLPKKYLIGNSLYDTLYICGKMSFYLEISYEPNQKYLEHKPKSSVMQKSTVYQKCH